MRIAAYDRLAAEKLRAEKCNHCRMESASPAVDEEIEASGFAILEMENCD